jgi:hypothetical protein
MPQVYKCWNCDRIFPYAYVSVAIEKGENRIVVEIPCKQPTYGSLGFTGADYVCCECIEEAIKEEGLS